jgi:Hydrazine synthase alpha subunit middle domain
MKLPNPFSTRALQGCATALAGAGALALAACGGGSKSESTTVTVQGDVPIVYAKRVNTIGLNPTNGAPTAPGGDLMIREKSSPSAPEHNMTTQFTLGKGDVATPEVSWDGKKILFSMRCPADNAVQVGGVAACTGHWNVWEYDMTTGGLTGGTFRRVTSSGDDDIHPVYLPAGQGIVFTSNRQTESHANQALGHSYYALDEYERERVFNLHTMGLDGSNITQISFNQSHDRNPVIAAYGPNAGKVMFSRWDHVGGRNHFKVFTVNPDGTNMFVLYGAHSDGNSFLHPRDMDPSGKYAGFLTSDLMPLQRTKEGGALMLIDVANYSEQNTPAKKSIAAVGGQVQATEKEVNIDRGVSMYGRFTSPYPLWDGTNRVLVSYRPCEVTKNGVVVPCSTLTTAELALLSDMDRPIAESALDPVKDDVPPPYAVYMFNPANQSMLPVAAPPAGFMYVDAVAIQPRAEPTTVAAAPLDQTLASQHLGTLNVKSVYDTDGLGRMGAQMLTAADAPAGCTTLIPQTAPIDADDTRATVADVARIKDPANPAYNCAPARFIRAVRAVAPPSSMMKMRSSLGETDFEAQQVLGYAPIEPDGSFKLNVPADTPIALAVIDAQGRALQTHTNWIQVRPGELRTCDGCHSPRRGSPINSGAVRETQPAGLLAAMASAHQSGESMAETRVRMHADAAMLSPDMVSTDVWADTSKAGVTARPSVALKFTGNANPADDLVTPVPTNGVINYPQHIQPLWTRDRGANTCTSCHNASDHTDLTASIGGDGRVVSYDRLMIGDPQLDASGRPVIFFDDGVPMIARLPALVNTAASEGEALGLARKSRLIEILSGQTLMSDASARSVHPNPPATAPDHSKMLNAAEKRLVAEWIDTGGKYYNDPFDPTSGTRMVPTLDEDSFIASVYPILESNCAGCHQALGSDGKPTTATSFTNNRFVLTGDPEGDWGVTMTMVNDVCHPPTSYLLARPSSVTDHPGTGTGGAAPILPANGANYATIASWIAAGCMTP